MPDPSAAWTFADLDDDELVYYTRQPCECKHPNETGTRNGYTCAAHRAQAEIDRRQRARWAAEEAEIHG